MLKSFLIPSFKMVIRDNSSLLKRLKIKAIYKDQGDSDEDLYSYRKWISP